MRKFGIEIEVGLKPGFTMADVCDALRDVGLGGSRHGYSGHSDSLWVVKLDGSVSNGVEVVSPPLNFDDAEQRAQVTTAVKALQRTCKPVPAGGIHVHVESRNLTPRQVAGVSRTFHHFEDVLYRLASSGWETIRAGARTYAKPLPEATKVALSKASTDTGLRRAYYGRHEAAFAAGHGHHSRYFALNLHSHFYRGTIEFRLFNSSLNPRRVQTYIAICIGIVQDAKNGHLRSINKAGRLGDMATGAKDAAQAFHHFQAVMRYQEGGMSLDDYKNLKVLWKDSKAQQRF